MADWNGVTPVTLDSQQFKNGIDITQYLLNPNMKMPTGTPDDKRVVARLYSAYDDNNIYLAMAVNEDMLKCNAGAPVVLKGAEIPYREGMPDGLYHIINQGDVLQFAFGFRDRVPGWGRQMDDPDAWKGHFNDTD